jgi:hypothetical protein
MKVEALQREIERMEVPEESSRRDSILVGEP